MNRQEFYVVIERDEDGLYVGEVPQLRACYSQGHTIDELLSNMREVIALCLEDEEQNIDSLTEFVGVQRIQL
jgi:predicted RNase H-like HicB family nuclease